MKQRMMVLLIFVSGVSPLSWSSEVTRSDQGVSCSELQALTSSVEELVSTLNASMAVEQKHQNVLIAIEYLQFKTRNIEGLEAEVRRVEDRRSGSQDRIDRMNGDIERMEQKKAGAEPDEAADIESMLDRYRGMAQTEADRLDRYERQIIDMENRVLDARRQLMDLEDFVAENLELGP